MPATPKPVIAQVRRQLADDAEIGMRVPAGVRDRVADAAVRGLWSSPIKTFVPILALRTAREILQEQDWLVTTEHRAMGASQASTTMSPRDERPRHDVLAASG